MHVTSAKLSSAQFSWTLHPPDNSLPYRPILLLSFVRGFSLRASFSSTSSCHPAPANHELALLAFPSCLSADPTCFCVPWTPKLPSPLRNSCEQSTNSRDTFQTFHRYFRKFPFVFGSLDVLSYSPYTILFAILFLCAIILCYQNYPIYNLVFFLDFKLMLHVTIKKKNMISNF